MRLPGWTFFLASLALASALAACSVPSSDDETQGPHGMDETAIDGVDDDLVDRDVVAYAEQCKAELGITEPLPDLSCTDGQLAADGSSWDSSRRTEIPITIGNVPVDASTYPQAIDQGCDRAHWLEQRCWTYDLIQRVDIKPEVEAVLNCRQKYRTNALGIAARKAAYEAAPAGEKVAAFKRVFEFDDLGYILRNKNTGKSCFFTSFGVSFYGGWIPAPDRRSVPSREEIYARLPEPKPPAAYDERQWNRGPRGHAELPQNMFFTPSATAGGGCIGCHNQGAFKHSPFVDQAMAPSVGRIVPANDRTKPYLLVGRAFKQSFRDFGIKEVDTGAGGENTCVGCHRMDSSRGGATTIAEWAVGVDPPAMSEWASQWPQRAWMKPGHRKTSEAAYREAYGNDIDTIMCCMRTPDARGCRSRVIGPAARDVKLTSDGSLDLAGWSAASSTATASCALD